MEAMGQMGNADEATLPDDIPFTVDDLIIVAEPMEVEDSKEPKEKAHGGVLHAAEGTYVSPSTGVIGTQQSLYANQPLTGAPTISVSGQPTNVTQPTAAPVGGYTPLFVGAPTTTTPAPTTTPTTPFVPTVEDAYTTVTYIDPSTGATIEINFYQGKPVQAIPAGYIPKSEYDAGNVGTGTGTTGQTGTAGQTGVSTTQVTAKDDSDKREILQLRDRADQERQQAAFQDKQNKLKSDNPDVLLDMWLDNKKTLGAGQGLMTLSPIIGGGTLAAGYREQTQIEKVLDEKFEGWREGKGGLSADAAAKLKEYNEAGGFRNTKIFGNALFEDAKKAVSGIKDSFSKEGRTKIYTNYAQQIKDEGPKYDVADNRLSGGAVGFQAVTDSRGAIQMNQHGMPQSSGNLSLKEQQSYDNAIRNGDSATANHHAIIAKHRAGQDNYAAAVDKYGADSIQAKNAGKNMSSASKEQAIKYGGSVHKASESGTASKTNTSGTGFFAKYEPNDSGNDDKDSSSKTGGYSCYVATALNNKGYWPTIKKMKLIKWCMDAKPEDKFDTKLWRNGYTVFGKTVIAPHVDNKIIQWLSDGFYDSRVKNKKDVKSLIGLLFFYIPSYTIALYKMLRNDLVDIERT